LTAFTGCGPQIVNPSVPVTLTEARDAWKDMRESPKPLERPLVVLGGLFDPGVAARGMERRLRAISQGKKTPIIHVGFSDTDSFDKSADKVIRHVNRAFEAENSWLTTEVDVVAFSMGGVVARYAASDLYATQSGHRLNINRLFTVSSPHCGARLAWLPLFDGRVNDMQTDSRFLHDLNAEACSYEIIPYTRLGDEVVGESNTAPPGQTPWWVATSDFWSHMYAYRDPCILADIGRRLRGEPTFTVDPPTPLPVNGRVVRPDGVLASVSP